MYTTSAIAMSDMHFNGINSSHDLPERNVTDIWTPKSRTKVTFSEKEIKPFYNYCQFSYFCSNQIKVAP